LALVQSPLEAVTEHSPERLALAHCIEQLDRKPDARGREINGERRIAIGASVTEVTAAQNRGRGRVLQAGRLDVTVRQPGSIGLDILDPAERAEVYAGRAVLRAQPFERAVRERCDPRIQPV